MQLNTSFLAKQKVGICVTNRRKEKETYSMIDNLKLFYVWPKNVIFAHTFAYGLYVQMFEQNVLYSDKQNN